MNIRIVTASLLFAIGAISPVQAQDQVAQDQVRGGKWTFTVRAQLSGMPHLPPGLAPPEDQMGGGRMVVTRTACISASNPIPLTLPGPGELPAQGDANGECRIDRLERSEGTVRWATTCISAEDTVHSEGVARYRGDTMERRAAGSGGSAPPAPAPIFRSI